MVINISCMVGLCDEICCSGCSRQPPTIIGRTMKRQKDISHICVCENKSQTEK